MEKLLAEPQTKALKKREDELAKTNRGELDCQTR